MKTEEILSNVTDLKSEPEALMLDDKHPGRDDPAYIARRTWFFETSREHRLQKKEIPHIDYTDEEHDIWHQISAKLLAAHEKHACDIYLQGKHLLDLKVDKIPSFTALNNKLKLHQDFQLAPAEGLIDTRNFFAYLSNRMMPCTQFLRHGANPEYTPEPDAIHDVIGHVPALMNKEYVELIQLIGEGVRHASDAELLAWERIYWFTIEFGLIEENGELKAFGAGLLSSFGELEYCFSDAVDRRPFVLEEVINQDYDPTRMQDIIYVIPSIAALHQEVQRLIDMNANG